jgi:hypothetical protein
MPQAKFTPEIITAAIEGFEVQKQRIDSQIAELRGVLAGGSTEPATTPSETAKPRKKFSAATRRKMALAQKARYAKLNQASEPPKAETKKPKRQISAAGRKAISEATKKRWALKRAESAQAQPATTETRPKRKISAAARRKMAAGAKKRWAATKKQSEPQPAV